jgi:hypothetical protein
MDGKKKIHIYYCIDYVSLVFIVGAVEDVEGFTGNLLPLNIRGESIRLTAYM